MFRRLSSDQFSSDKFNPVNRMQSQFSKIKLPVLLMLAVGMVLAMLRLGIWQLDRAEQKTEILNQLKAYATLPPVDLVSMLSEFSDEMRFRNVIAQGRYLADKSIYIDNQVVAGQVGYRVFTPFLLANAKTQKQPTTTIMVDRGWVSVGESRSQLPTFKTSVETLTLSGRLNTAPSKPPIWNDKYSVSEGQLWQYLPLQEYALQMHLSVLPLVLELAPEPSSNELKQQFKRIWADISDEWVAKHQGYAFQWFAMAVAFSIACLVLLLRHNATSKNQSS